MTQTSDVLRVKNADGSWFIYKRCIDYDSGSFRYTVGPGYIGRVNDHTGRVVVNDLRARSDSASPGLINEVNGGLGTYGWHHARGPVGATQAGDDPTTTPLVEPPVGRFPIKAVEGRMCPQRNNGAGVYARSPVALRWVNAYRLDVTMDIWFKDDRANTGWGVNQTGDTNTAGDAIARVRYRYSFYRSSVRTWISVTMYPAGSGNSTPFVKEPKLSAITRGGGFTRMSVFGGADGRSFLLGQMSGDPSTSTRHTDNDERKRVRWDFAPNTSGDANPGCLKAKPCFFTIMRAHPTTNGDVLRSSISANWEGSPFGMDRWAVLADTRAAAYPRDTAGDNQITTYGVDPTPADNTDGVPGFSDVEESRVSERATPAQPSRRRWEHGGFKSGDVTDPYQSAFTFFAGWEDDRGPEDCEPLQRAFGTAPESWGSAGLYSLSSDPGWTGS